MRFEIFLLEMLLSGNGSSCRDVIPCSRGHFDTINVVYIDSDTAILKMYRKNLFSKHVGETKQRNTLLLFMEGYTKVQVDFDQVRIQMVWSEDGSLLRPSRVTELRTSSMPHGET